MNPDEAWIGKALFVGIISFVVWVISILISSKGEGAKRLRLIVVGAIALGVAALLFAMVGPVGLLVILVIGAAGVWVYNGFKK
jgi:O-antigen/teichoic acid export membrane protein